MMDEWKSKQDKCFLEGTRPAGRVPFLEIFGPCSDGMLSFLTNFVVLDVVLYEHGSMGNDLQMQVTCSSGYGAIYENSRRYYKLI